MVAKLTIALTLLCISFGVLANDFRTMSFGDSCSTIEGDEYQLGSTQVESEPNKAKFRVFSSIHFDREVSVVYVCDGNNKFEYGAYFYKFYEKNDLEFFLESTIPQLILKYGEATPESHLFTKVTKNDIWIAYEWKLENLNINATITGNLNEPNPEKALGIVFRKPE